MLSICEIIGLEKKGLVVKMGCDFYVMKDGKIRVKVRNQEGRILLDQEITVTKDEKIYYSIYSTDDEVLRDR